MKLSELQDGDLFEFENRAYVVVDARSCICRVIGKVAQGKAVHDSSVFGDAEVAKGVVKLMFGLVDHTLDDRDVQKIFLSRGVIYGK